MSAPETAVELYTSDSVRRIDRSAIERCGIPGFTLMQRAADAAFASLRRRWPDARRIGVVAGPGNNGGDAFLLARAALHAGLAVEVLTLSGEAHGDAAQARAAFTEAGGRFVPLRVDTPLPDADVHVDGLFGTGLRRAVAGPAAALIDRLNACGRPLLALDLPSGLDADTGTCPGAAVRAAATVSFVAWKRGLFTADAADCCGALELATLDVPGAAYAGIDADAMLLDAGIDRALPPRSNNVNKGRFGHVLTVGGDHGMGGAVRLAGEAALRVGAGLVSIATRTAHVVALNAGRPELMAHGSDDPQSLAPLLERASVVALGPGLGQGAWGHALWDAALSAAAGRDCTFVLDADALNLLARQPRPLPVACVLTPHPGEAARLLGCDIATVQRDRFAAVRALAQRHRAVVVLKGSGSLVADPAGCVAVCRWGNPGMASAGMGDVLTGVVAGLLAQGLSGWDAARLGVAVHARAGDAAAGAAPRGLIASDLFAGFRTFANRFPDDGVPPQAGHD
ncbi:MAG TPA: NAD(P)H-hydrate dehydratase [Rhodanobacteraceae bacterium]|nr:NAD(P)H-hydrate dehydratase [Rhodanobacteraceae bacterium]